MNSNAQIHIVDDDASLRAALTCILNDSGFDTVEYASAGYFLLSHPESHRGCLLLDVRPPAGPSGLDLHAALGSQGIEMPVVFIMGHADVQSCCVR